MRVSESKNETGSVYQHFIGREYTALIEIKRAAEFMAKEVKLISLDNCNNVWLLTVETVKI